MATVAEPNGVIHDIGYRRYDGPRLGRWYAVRSLYLHGVRTAFGLGRSGKAKVFPWLVAGIVTLVAAIFTAVRSQVGQVVVSYVQFPQSMTVLILMFSAVVAPELVSRDLRSGVLPLYFSRPLHRGDYAMAKLAALVTATWLLIAGPQLLMFLGGVFSVDSIGKVWDEVGDFLPGLAYSFIYAAVYASIALLVASLASRRAVAAAVVVAVFLVTTPVVGVLSLAPSETVRQLASLASPTTLVGGVGDWLFRPGDGSSGIGDFGPLYGAVTLGVVAACVALLVLRYRKVAQ
ncbi:MAG: ABC transporter permease [Micromonosporaceae bacterium]